jgi:hypothetical protein
MRVKPGRLRPFPGAGWNPVRALRPDPWVFRPGGRAFRPWAGAVRPGARGARPAVRAAPVRPGVSRPDPWTACPREWSVRPFPEEVRPGLREARPEVGASPGSGRSVPGAGQDACKRLEAIPEAPAAARGLDKERHTHDDDAYNGGWTRAGSGRSRPGLRSAERGFRLGGPGGKVDDESTSPGGSLTIERGAGRRVQGRRYPAHLEGDPVSREAVCTPAPGGGRDEGACPRTVPLAPRAVSTLPLPRSARSEPGAGQFGRRVASVVRLKSLLLVSAMGCPGGAQARSPGLQPGDCQPGVVAPTAL